MKRLKRLHRYAENRSRVYDSLLHTPEARVQHTLSIVGRGYESEQEDHGDDNDDDDNDEGQGISGQGSTHNFINKSVENSDCEISQKTERSQGICNSCRQSGARSTAENLSSAVVIRETSEEENSSGQAGDVSTTEETEAGSEEVGTSSRQHHAASMTEETEGGSEKAGPCAAPTAEVGGAASPSTSSEAALPAVDISDSTRNRGTRTRSRKIPCWLMYSDSSNESSDSSDSPSETHRKRVKHQYGSAESRSSVTGSNLHTRKAKVQHNFSTGERGYESEPELPEDKRAISEEREAISAQESTHCLIPEVDEYCSWEITHEADRSQEISCRQAGAAFTTEESEVRSEEEETSSSLTYVTFMTEGSEGSPEEAATSCRQSCTAFTAEVAGALSPLTSSTKVFSAAYESESSSDGNSEKCPICFITFRAQEVGTPDTCDHLFCIGCIEEWSANANTCPLDRRRFNAILVRDYPDEEVIRRIPVSPRYFVVEYEDFIQQGSIFCGLCGENDRQDSMLNCQDCGFFYHPVCIISAFNTTTLSEWMCPVCLALTSDTEVN
jgi:hypothetical protein